MSNEYDSIIKELEKEKSNGYTVFYPHQFVPYITIKELITNGYRCFLKQSVFGDDEVFITWDPNYKVGAFDYEYTIDMIDKYIGRR